MRLFGALLLALARPSPWYQGAHRIMIPFGCTRAPSYDADPRCEKKAKQ